MAGGDAGFPSAFLHPGPVLLENSKGSPEQPERPTAEASQAESPADDLGGGVSLLPLLAPGERLHMRPPAERGHKRGHALAGIPADGSHCQAGGLL